MIELFRPSLVALVVILPSASAGAAPDPGSQIPNASNTDYQCVLLARTVLGQAKADAVRDIPALIKCLEGDYHYFERGAAKIALVHIGPPAIPALIEAMDHDPSPYISEGAAITLGQMGPRARDAIPALVDTLRRNTTAMMLRPEAAKAIGKIGEIALLIRTMEGKESGIQSYLGAQGLGAAGPAAASAVPALMDALKSSDPGLQMYAAEALGYIGAAANPAVPQLAELSRSRFNFLNAAAGEALVQINTPQAQTASRAYRWRKGLFDGFFRTMAVFVWNPFLAFAVGIGLGILAFVGVRTSRRPMASLSLVVPAVCWVLYAFWEYHCKRVGANIRIDLLAIYPFLAVTTLLGLSIGCAAFWRPKSEPR